MNIITVGCGKIGTTIASSLAAEGHNVVIIDSDPTAIADVTDIYDIMGVCGNGADCETLSEAGVESAEMFVSVTGSDELNMLSCFLAKKMGAKHTIARIRNPEYNDKSLGFMRQELGLSMAINPELLAAKELFNMLKFPSAVKIEPFSRGNFELIELKVKENSLLAGRKLSDLREKYKAKFLICAVQRGTAVHIPDGNFELLAGDRICLTAAPAEIQKLLKAVGVLRKQARNVMILGGSRTAYYLAKMLIGSGNTVKIIEKEKTLCDELCAALPKASIIHGDGAKQELLLEEGLLTADAFVSLTDMDEENILISFYAYSNNVPKVISKINRDEIASIAENLGLDSFVSPKMIISDIIVSYARALQNSLGSNVETLYKLIDGKAEALEFNVSPNSDMLGIPLKDLRLKPNIIIAGIIRDRKTIIPSGDDVILQADRVIVIAADRRLNDLADILK